MVPGNEIEIDDLRNPIPTSAHLEELARLRDREFNLDFDAILKAAVKRTGFDDFGADDFRERLHTQLLRIANDANRSKLGLLAAQRRATRWASTRLKLQQLLKLHPEIENIEIRRPIIITGAPRSGTSHLVNILASDPQLRSAPLWELYDPIPNFGNNTTLVENDLRISRADKKWERMKKILPHLDAMHSMEPNRAQEEFELQGPNFAAGLLGGVAHVPDVSELAQDDPCSNYSYLKTMLKALQWFRGPNRWLLKSPGYAENLDVLIRTFPDASIVITHRDPLPVVRSALTMLAYIGRMEFHTVETYDLGHYWLDRIEKMYRAILLEREHARKNIASCIRFSDFMANEEATVQRIYEAVGMSYTSTQESLVHSFLDNNPRGKDGRVVYNLESNFDMDSQSIIERFGFYYKCFAEST